MPVSSTPTNRHLPLPKILQFPPMKSLSNWPHSQEAKYFILASPRWRGWLQCQCEDDHLLFWFLCHWNKSKLKILQTQSDKHLQSNIKEYNCWLNFLPNVKLILWKLIHLAKANHKSLKVIILLYCSKTELNLKPGTQSIAVASFGRVCFLFMIHRGISISYWLCTMLKWELWNTVISHFLLADPESL